ncbi:hypothetical protein D9M72_508700 [compost metagenome]
MEKEVRGGFAVPDVLCTENTAVKARQQAREAQCFLQPGVTAVRRDAGLRQYLRKRVLHSGNERQFLLKGVGGPLLVLQLPVWGKSVAEKGLQFPGEVVRRPAHEAGDDLLLAQDPAVVREHSLIDLDAEHLAAHEGPVAIKDD